MSRSSTLGSVTAVFLALTWITLLVRCWVRLKLVKIFGLDDKWMVVAQLFYTIFTIVTIVGTFYGFGKHSTELSPENLMLALRAWWIGEIAYTFAAVMVKIAICLFLLRIVVQRLHKWIIYITIAVVTIYSFCFFIVVVDQCHPVSYYWNHNQHGQCHPDLMIGATIAYGVVCMATDFTIGIIPIFIVRHLQMNFRTKCAVAGILAMATVASVATVIRFPYIPNFSHTSDFFWDAYGISLWSNIEPGMGIVAGNLATMRPLLQLLIANTTRLTNSMRSSDLTVSPAGPKQGGPGASLAKPVGAHIDHNRANQKEGNYTFLSSGDHKGSEYGVHAWHSDSKEELMHIAGDIELGSAIYQKSELIVREETVSSSDESQRK